MISQHPLQVNFIVLVVSRRVLQKVRKTDTNQPSGQVSKNHYKTQIELGSNEVVKKEQLIVSKFQARKDSQKLN